MIFQECFSIFKIFQVKFCKFCNIFVLLQHGESEYNVLGKVGGDAVLSARGERYAQALSNKFNSMRVPDLRVLTSRLRRTIATARGIEAPQEHVAALNELHAGVCEGLSYEEMQEHYPQVCICRHL